jgi:hypothetical protein
VVFGAHDGVCGPVACHAQFVVAGGVVCDAAYWFGVDGTAVAACEPSLRCGGVNKRFEHSLLSVSAKRGRDA